MTDHRVRELLDQVRAIRNRTDLDLLLFFSRHPEALLTLEQLAAAVGHDRARMESSLDALIEGGTVVRTSNSTRAAHSFTFRPAEDAPLQSLLQIASSRTGRLAL